ncbi:hypothetical protein [Pseudovibrio sp. Tun.PSC04-5.I4]|uniref:hypothetical protein n=1 Tax=Pseudovibrio sp. Tun.PSC04-5.I4 TaxID=1798213 RepID=UPI0008849C58|nr:hypothetical protein [Pseudovibrio sp. Tun.PSC04-5.I4]SDR36402.1 hypothetical protein SAMN04515695_4974 [Pseudovibrio sp. Tun.PSC04-5.I4]
MLKVVVTLCAVLNGGWMLFDGIHVLRHGKYFGPAEPGPWQHIVKMIGLKPMTLGPVFVIFGIDWLLLAAYTLMPNSHFFWPALVIAISTLWYIKIGTGFSLIVLLVLLFI